MDKPLPQVEESILRQNKRAEDPQGCLELLCIGGISTRIAIVAYHKLDQWKNYGKQRGNDKNLSHDRVYN